jgi:serine O-acetyltransferase
MPAADWRATLLAAVRQPQEQARTALGREEAHSLIERLLAFLFPRLDPRCPVNSPVYTTPAQELNALEGLLLNCLHTLELPRPATEIAVDWFRQLPTLYALICADAESLLQGDPAATSLEEVILCYPGFLAVAVYRLAHALHQLQVPLLPRILTEYAHRQTGIDIHPGAVIGPSFCIDHGTGVVIGETTEIGREVKLYQGVTLGALSVDKSLARTKRHPTIEDRVVIYAGATILGGETVIGHDSIIGGNVWLTRSVPPRSQVYHQSSIQVRSREA